jgi:biopolymer transport protein ExbD
VPRKTPLTSLRQISEINLTPLMDLTFILLITFIITFPLIEQGILVNLPKANATDLSPDTAMTISLDKDGAVYLDEVRTSLEELAARMKEQGRDNPDVTIMIRADERLNYGKVVEIMKILHDANMTKMALVTQQQAEG